MADADTPPQDPQRQWALDFAEALQVGAPDLAGLIRMSEDFKFVQDPADLIQHLQASAIQDPAPSALSTTIAQVMTLADHAYTQAAVNQADLDRVQQSHASLQQQNTNLQQENFNLRQQQLSLYQRLDGQIPHQQDQPSTRRLSTDPAKFLATETNISKRHQNFVTFQDKVLNCIEQDSHIFNTDFKRIHYICTLLDGDAYEAIRDGLRTIKKDTEQDTWTWRNHHALLKHLASLYATTDITFTAKMDLDKLTMGNTPFPTFHAVFNRLADRCKRQPIQKVEMLKQKVNRELLSNAILKGLTIEDDDYEAWCKLFQTTWQGMEMIQHINSLSDNNKKGTTPHQAQKAPQITLPVTQHPSTPHPDAMDLSAFGQGPPNQGARRPPPGVDVRKWCAENQLCFYCKTPGHMLANCNAKRASDKKRATGELPPQQPYNSYPQNNTFQPYAPSNQTFPRNNSFQPRGNNSFQPRGNSYQSYNLGPMQNLQNRAITGFIEDGSVHSTTASTLTPDQSISRAGTPSHQGN
jgi:hypothetical protein